MLRQPEGRAQAGAARADDDRVVLVLDDLVPLRRHQPRAAAQPRTARPEQRTPIRNFFLAGSYTRQDYIDSMEGATMSGHLAAAAIRDQPVKLATNAAVA